MTRSWQRVVGSSIACLSFFLLPIPAMAQDRPREPSRTVGAGFGVGVGPSSVSPYHAGLGDDVDHFEVSLGSLELSAFVDDHLSVDVSLQPWWTVASAIAGGFGWASTVYVDWSFGQQHRFLIGPGVGAHGHTSDVPNVGVSRPDGGVELRLAGLLGYEYLRDDSLFGFRLVTRPWLSFGGGDQGFQLGGGALVEALFMFYETD